MKLCYADIQEVISLQDDCVHSLIIENPAFMYRFLTEIRDQLNGFEGKAVVSKNDTILDFAKNVELLTDFIPFDLNTKTLQSKILSSLTKTAVEPEYFEQTQQILQSVERYLMGLSYSVQADICFKKVSIESLLKAFGLEIRRESDSLAENLLDYFGLVREFDRDKLFITLNIRSFIGREEIELFFKNVIQKGYRLLMVENYAGELFQYERRLVIDKDLCEIKMND